MNITAMTFNLRICRITDLHNAWPFRRERAAGAILAQKPWVVGTQEGTSRMLGDLDRLLPGYERFGLSRRGGVRGEHTAIYYQPKKLELLEWGQFWLSPDPEAPGSKGWDARLPQACTWGRFRLRKEPERELLVYNTRLSRVGERARTEGVQVIWSYIRQHMDRFGVHPVLICGDFNAGPADTSVRFLSGELELGGRLPQLENVFADPAHAGRTYHGFQGGKTGQPIDFLFAGYGLEPLHGDVNRSRYGGRYPSDHYPVTGIFRLRPQNR